MSSTAYVTDLFEEAVNVREFKIVRCDKDTLNSPSKSELNPGNISGYAFISMKPGNLYGHITFMTDGKDWIFHTNYNNGSWSGWKWTLREPVVLWSGTANTPLQVLKLNDSIRRYKYVDVTMYYSGTLGLLTFEIFSSSTYFVCKAVNTTDSLSKLDLCIAEIGFTITSETSLTLGKNSCIECIWLGDITKPPTKKNLGDNCYLSRIVGRMN